MKIIQDNGGFSQDELQSYKYIVYGNCVTQMKVLVSAAVKIGATLDSEENMVCFQNRSLATFCRFVISL